jgi:hypothetical protein
MAGEKIMVPALRGCPLGEYARGAEPFPANPALTGRPWGAKRLPG